MKILIGHNYYQQPGGEDAVFRSHVDLLKEYGHDVCLYERRNDEITPNLLSQLGQAMSLRWSQKSYNDIQKLISDFKPDVAHFHNIFFVTTPSVLYACKEAGIPVVLSLHNFRLMCVNGLFFRDHKPCEDCLQGSWVQGIAHKCYRGSMVYSALAGDMVQYHWKKKTWTNIVDCVITATEFSRQKYIQAGISSERIKVLPHCIAESKSLFAKDAYALYVGRLSEEKGLSVLLDAWRNVKDIKLIIVGSGPMQEEMAQSIKDEQLDHIEMCGFVDQARYVDLISRAHCLIVPSLCYENFPRVVVEAYSVGTPVLASRLGTFEEIVKEEHTGYLFKAGCAIDLAYYVQRIFSDKTKHVQMCHQARDTYIQLYTSQKYHTDLLKIYSDLIS